MGRSIREKSNCKYERLAEAKKVVFLFLESGPSKVVANSLALSLTFP